MRVGIGYDCHRLVEGRKLILGGVTVPFEKGLEGHSDGDVLAHALADALLGAAALGDLGRLFPDTDAEWKDANSLDLLVRVVSLLAEKGWRPAQVDSTILADAPKLAPQIDRMRALVARTLKIDLARVSIKAKTMEGLGSIGRGEAMAAHAVAVLERW